MLLVLGQPEGLTDACRCDFWRRSQGLKLKAYTINPFDYRPTPAASRDGSYMEIDRSCDMEYQAGPVPPCLITDGAGPSRVRVTLLAAASRGWGGRDRRMAPCPGVAVPCPNAAAIIGPRVNSGTAETSGARPWQENTGRILASGFHSFLPITCNDCLGAVGLMIDAVRAEAYLYAPPEYITVETCESRRRCLSRGLSEAEGVARLSDRPTIGTPCRIAAAS